MTRNLSLGLPLFLAITALLNGCATSPLPSGMTAAQLVESICAQGGQPSVVMGSVWAQVESPEMKGQFPATFRVERGGPLVLEITDLIGTPQAWLRMVQGRPPELRLSAANQRKMGNDPSPQIWAGLPLEFAPTLFLGKVPCPRVAGHKLVLGEVNDEDFEVRSSDPVSGATRIYRYSFQDFGGKPWVNRLHYRLESGGRAESEVTLEFTDPTDPGAYAKRWQASSSKGQIKVRWKDRNVRP